MVRLVLIILLCSTCLHLFSLHLHLGHLADAFIQSNLKEVCLLEERETTMYIAVGTVRMFIEPTAKH